MDKNDNCINLRNIFIQNEEYKLSSKALVLLLVLINISTQGLSVDGDNFIKKDLAIDVLRLKNKKDAKEPYKYIYRYFEELRDANIINITQEYKSNKIKHIHFIINDDVETKGERRREYVKVPCILFYDSKNITINELMTFISIKYGHNDIKSDKTNEELASLGLLSIRLIKSSLTSLEAKGILKREGKGKGRKLIIGKVHDDEKHFFYEKYNPESQRKSHSRVVNSKKEKIRPPKRSKRNM